MLTRTSESPARLYPHLTRAAVVLVVLFLITPLVSALPSSQATYDLPYAVNHGGSALAQDQLIDLGIIAPGDVKRLVFSIRNDSQNPLTLGPTPVTLEGNELNMPTAMPAELKPGQKKFFAIDTTGLGEGTTIRKVTVQAGDPSQIPAFEFRIRLTVLSVAYAQQAVSDLYDRYRDFAAADHQTVDVTLDQFQTHYQPALDSMRYLDLFDYVQVEQLGEIKLVSGYDADDAVSLTPKWRTVDSEIVSADSARAQTMDTWTVSELVNNATAENFIVAELVAATQYQVQLQFDGISRNYKAALLWTRDPQNDIYIHDRVITGLSSIRSETRTPISSSALQQQILPMTRLNGLSAAADPGFTKSGVPGAAQCHANETSGEREHGRHGSEGHDSGEHRSGHEFRWTCKQQSDCTNRCETDPVAYCLEGGDISAPPFSMIEHKIVESFAVPQHKEAYLEAVSCSTEYGCAIGKCYGPLCIDNFHFGYSGETLTFGVTLGGDTAVADLSWSDERVCPPPVQCDPNPDDDVDFPGGPCEGVQTDGPHQVSFTAELVEVGSPLGGFTGSATVTLISSAGSETLVADADGTYTFSALLENGDTYNVTAMGQGQNVFCRVTDGSGTIDGTAVDDVVVSCTQVRIPEGCPANAVECITPPDGCTTVPGDRGYSVVTTTNYQDALVVMGGDMFVTAEVTYDITIFLSPGQRSCGGSLRYPGAATKSGGITEGPILYSRNNPDEAVSGVIPIWGVARDDFYGVTDVDVYIDEQLVSLSQFQFNLENSQTCSHYSSGAPCDTSSSYYGLLDTSTLSPGLHTVTVTAINSEGVPSVFSHDLRVANPAPPNVRLVASYLPEGAGQRTTYSSQSASAMTPLRFDYDQSQGNFLEREGGACGPGVDNSTYLKVRLGGDSNLQIDGCEIRSSWDSQWITCPPGLVDAANQREYFVLNTDSHLYSSCNFSDPVGPLLGADQPAWFKARFFIDGITYERRIDFEKAP